jgi:hypothetical protein
MGTQKSRAPLDERPESENIHRHNRSAVRRAWQAILDRLDVLGLALLVAVVWVAAALLWRAVFR